MTTFDRIIIEESELKMSGVRLSAAWDRQTDRIWSRTVSMLIMHREQARVSLYNVINSTRTASVERMSKPSFKSTSSVTRLPSGDTLPFS